jgi:site-specific recombinase XerD
MSDLFDTDETWRLDPASAFAAFVRTPDFLTLGKRKAAPNVDANGNDLPPSRLRSSSAEIYILMFGRFLRWLTTQNKTLFDVSRTDLMAFLVQGAEGEGAEQDTNTRKSIRSSEIRRRYLGLLDRVYAHLKVANPAQHASFEIFKSGDRTALGKNVEKVFLSEAQQAAFMAALPVPTARTEKDPTIGWKTRRNRAMQAMMLGAGLKVSEVIGVYTENFHAKESTGSIPITISPGSAGGIVRWHQTQLRPFAVPEVTQWIEERIALKIPGPLLFPATLNGARMNKVTVYRNVQPTFERAGIDVARQGGRTLRNAFAVRELTAGESIELVGEFMGHRKRRSIEPYAAKASPLKTGRVLGEPK